MDFHVMVGFCPVRLGDGVQGRGLIPSALQISFFLSSSQQTRLESCIAICPSPLELPSAPTKFSHRLAQAEWAKSIAPTTPASIASSPSRYSLPRSPPILTACNVSHKRPAPPPR